ncbi:MAG: hypothetical protein EU531_03895 [Promethearchaeota archaeon]|nr:MAG: hypothetical protein EU531_03895 [Candidatus Lokiarchaeota archaeon]
MVKKILLPFDPEIIENIYILYLDFFPKLFLILKFFLVIILFSLGVLYLLSLKGNYLRKKLLKIEDETNDFNNISIILGIVFIMIAFGVLFNYLIYFFIWVFQYYDGFILISLSLFEDFMVKNFGLNITVFNDTITPLIALGSFISILQIIFVLFYFTNNRFVVIRPKKSIVILTTSVIQIFLFGFECLPYLL